MDTLSDTSTSTTMPLAVIPVAIDQLGPQLSRLPDELVQLIFKMLVTTLFPPRSRFNSIIGPQSFTILNHYQVISRIRAVSPAFRAFFTQAFYENFTFAFKHSPIYNFVTEHLTSIPPPVPSPHLRHHLRSMHIDIALETYYYTPQRLPNMHNSIRLGRTARKIVLATQMIAFCASARFLLLLTNDEYGFRHLRFLHLHICMDEDLFKVDDEFLKALEDARLVVKAKVVEIVVTNGAGFDGKRYDEVKQRIGVVH